jgi:hypothetical protein
MPGDGSTMPQNVKKKISATTRPTSHTPTMTMTTRMVWMEFCLPTPYPRPRQSHLVPVLRTLVT